MNTLINQKIKLKDGRNLGFAEYGDSKGKPVLYFHGWPSCRLAAAHMDKPAKKLHVRLISVDRPGYGLSDYKKGRSLLDWPDDVIELANMLKIQKFSVIGVSGGGPYAAVCGYKNPQRINNVGITVGIAPTYIPGILDGMGFLAKLSWGNYARIAGLKTAGTWLRYMQNKYYLTSKDQILKTKETFRQGIKGPRLDLKLYTENWGFKLKDIKTRVYLWYGALDKKVSLAMGKYYSSQIPKSKLVIYPDEGHFCGINHEEEILKQLIN